MPYIFKSGEGYTGMAEIFKVNPFKIHIRDDFNPRRNFDDLDELKESIRNRGFLVSKPVVVCKDGTRFVLIDGERRLRAVYALQAEGHTVATIPAVLEPASDPATQLARALAENNGQKPLEPLEEAQAYARLAAQGWSFRAIANEVGRSASHVSNRLALLQADTDVSQALTTGEITTSDAVKVVSEARQRGTPQRDVLERTVAAKARRTTNDEEVLHGLVTKCGLPWVLEQLAERHTVAHLRGVLARVAQSV